MLAVDGSPSSRCSSLAGPGEGPASLRCSILTSADSGDPAGSINEEKRTCAVVLAASSCVPLPSQQKTRNSKQTGAAKEGVTV